MQKNFTNDSFEDFLKQNAEEMKMHPSDNVWKNISKDINKRKWRFGFSLTALVVSVSLIGYHIFDSAKSLPESFKALASAEVGTTNKPVTTSTENKLTVASINTDVSKNVVNKKSVSSRTNNDNHLPVNNNFSASDINNETKEQAIVVALAPIYLTENIEKIEVKKDDLQKATEEENNIAEQNLIAAITETEKTAEEKEENPIVNEQEIEKAITKIAKAKNKKLDLQLYFTPTVSYRKLTENKTFSGAVPQPNTPGNLAVLYDVNSMVTHKPAIGLELGYTAKYAINNKIKVRGGLQFNINRYDIKAFFSGTELATIALNNSNTASINTTTNYRSYGTSANTNWLENMYFQASVPLGAEVKLYSNDNVQFGIASTIQPTYIIGDRAYVISSDYKNYAEVPWLIRRWNVNTAFETFVAYSTGKLNWQVGPQVRYQMFSSFIDKYPVKENLFDFGLKVGISLNK